MTRNKEEDVTDKGEQDLFQQHVCASFMILHFAQGYEDNRIDEEYHEQNNKIETQH